MILRYRLSYFKSSVLHLPMEETCMRIILSRPSVFTVGVRIPNAVVEKAMQTARSDG